MVEDREAWSTAGHGIAKTQTQLSKLNNKRASPVAQWAKNPAAMQETQEMEVQFLGWEDPLKEEMAAHSRILAWEILWTGEPGGIQSMRLQRVGHN